MSKLHSLISLVVLCVLFAIASVSLAQTEASERYRVMTYNVENLYDTCHDAGFDDYEFLPTSSHAWNGPRYFKKLGQLARVIAAAGGASPVDLVGLCEVENDTVLRDLTERTMLRRLGYRFVITHGPDLRGVDVGLLYQPDRFKLLLAEDLAIPVDSAYGRPTRDILHVCGILPTTDTLDVMVCHMPSRRGGTAAVEAFRRKAGRTLRHYVDSIRAQRTMGHVLIMGDFNDEYTDSSIAVGLGAKKPASAVSADGLYVLSADLREGDICGTYRYKGQWNTLDQMMVSGTLLDASARFRTAAGACHIFAPAFLLTVEKTHGGQQPWRTYLGPYYQGGISDHLPLVLDFEIR